jgi:hypothetical protein
MRWVLVLSCLVLVACAGGSTDDAPGFEAPLDLRAEINKEQVQLLQRFDLKLSLYHDKGVEVEFAPAVPAGFAGAVQEQGKRRTENGTVLEYVLALRPVRLGELTIPAFTATAGEHEASTDEILIQVGSLLGADADLAAIEEPAPLFPPRVNYLPWVLGAAGLVLRVFLVVWFMLRPRKVILPREMPLPPHVKALRALARLRSAPRQTEAEVEAFYVEVSAVLRVYLEERFGLHAPERTTEEFLAEIEQGDALTAEQRRSLGRFLQQCDLVKFARLIPDSAVHDQTFQIAATFVEQTRPDQVPGIQPGIQGGAA